jgi:HD superfamily phosphohydrolase YqeK
MDMDVKAAAFEPELKVIFDEGIREFAKLCICAAPDYFFLDCPASSTGKYHPLDELGADGTLIHTKKVFTTAYELARGLGCEENRDEILAACLIHDLRKQGLTQSGHTARNHPALAADLVEEVQAATQMLTDKSYKIIRNAVGYHYGPWSSGDWKKPLDKYTPEEMCLYLADYIASKRVVAVDYRR